MESLRLAECSIWREKYLFVECKRGACYKPHVFACLKSGHGVRFFVSAEDTVAIMKFYLERRECKNGSN